MSDKRKGCVISMSMDGKVKGKYVLNPDGITVDDEDGSIFVCTSTETYTSILQLSEDCEFIQVLSKTSDYTLRAITYCREAHCLYIAGLLKRNPIISVVETEQRCLHTNDDI